MAELDWRDDLKGLFEDIKIIEESKIETLENFDQFWEFIAQPAFENLKAALKQYRIKARFKRKKGKSILFRMNFPRSRIDDFLYIIYLPKNSLELKLKLRIKGRPDKQSPLVEREEQFMKNVDPSMILKLTMNELIQDVIEHYRKFKFENLTRPE